MKKVFDKIISVTLGVVSLFFVLLMLVTAFGGLQQVDLDNNVVKALLITLAVIFALLTAFQVAISFRDDEKLNAVLLYKDKESSAKATVAVVKKTAKRVAKVMKAEARIGKVQIVSDDAGNTRLKVDVKILTDRTEETSIKLRAILVESFKKIFGIEFSSIDFRIVKSKSTYVPGEAEVAARISELKANVKSDADEGADVRIQPDDGIIIPKGGDTDEILTAESAEETENSFAASEVREETTSEPEAVAAEEEVTETQAEAAEEENAGDAIADGAEAEVEASETEGTEETEASVEDAGSSESGNDNAAAVEEDK